VNNGSTRAWEEAAGPALLPLSQVDCDAATQPTALTSFGLFAVSAMLICCAREARSHWFVLGFAFACALGSLYGFLQGAWPFGLVEAIWAVVAGRRWM
jgi:hypothetical protein